MGGNTTSEQSACLSPGFLSSSACVQFSRHALFGGSSGRSALLYSCSAAPMTNIARQSILCLSNCLHRGLGSRAGCTTVAPKEDLAQTSPSLLAPLGRFG